MSCKQNRRRVKALPYPASASPGPVVINTNKEDSEALEETGYAAFSVSMNLIKLHPAASVLLNLQVPSRVTI